MERFREAAGLILLGAGVIGCFLPIIPGIPFLVGAALVLGPSHRWVKPWMDRIQLGRDFLSKRTKTNGFGKNVS